MSLEPRCYVAAYLSGSWSYRTNVYDRCCVTEAKILSLNFCFLSFFLFLAYPVELITDAGSQKEIIHSINLGIGNTPKSHNP